MANSSYVIGRKWLPKRINGLWLALSVWWIESHTGGVTIRLSDGDFLPPKRAVRAWRVLHIARMKGEGRPIDG